MTKLRNSNFYNSKTQIVTKLKNQIVTKLKKQIVMLVIVTVVTVEVRVTSFSKKNSTT